jgi:hypothetical protein
MFLREEYTPEQARFARAFSRGATLCSAECQACRRIHFVSCRGHGDYEPGELEALKLRREKEPDKYVEWDTFDSIGLVNIEGKQLVVGCPCDPTKRLTTWIEHWADELTDYLRYYYEDQRKMAQAAVENGDRRLADLKTCEK